MTAASRELRIEDWGLVEYQAAVERQLACVEEVVAGGEERVVFVTHPPVVTLGRGTPDGDLLGWSGSTVESSRGGRATYHGPNQIVIYPILDLRHDRGGAVADGDAAVSAGAAVRPRIPARDIHAYLRALETATVNVLHDLGMPTAEARTTKIGELSLTGVWVGNHKIASMGIAVRKWVTYHGVAVNIVDDPSAFQGIRPCGFSSDVMTSAERELGRPLNMGAVKDLFASEFRRIFSAAT